ncbi:MAG: septum formation initiator family protein [Nitrospirota bacterium]|mgnify:CR=1 FL=1
MRNSRQKEVESKKKIKRTVFITCGILIIGYLFLKVVFSDNGLLKYLKLKSMMNNLRADTENIIKQNDEKKKRIEEIKKTPGLLEELARKQGLTKDGENIYMDDKQ